LNNKLLTLYLSFLLTGCAITGPADDGYDNNNEWIDNGRLLSEETKVIYSSSNGQSTKVANQPNASSETDFAAYKQWQDAKENNSPEYQKFRQWQEYEAFQRWKEQQQSN